jgi:hypothetical protein
MRLSGTVKTLFGNNYTYNWIYVTKRTDFAILLLLLYNSFCGIIKEANTFYEKNKRTQQAGEIQWN